MNKNLNILFLLTDGALGHDDMWALGADPQSLMLMTFDMSLGELFMVDHNWYPRMRVGPTKTEVLVSITSQGINLSSFAKAKFKSLPDDFWILHPTKPNPRRDDAITHDGEDPCP